MYMHKSGYLTYPKPQERSLPQEQKRPQTPNLSTEDLWPKTLHILATGSEEEDVEQEDMTYTAGSFSLP